jgi:hypothetical protein
MEMDRMSKVRRRATAVSGMALAAALLALTPGCTQLTAGKSYMLTKTDASGYLRDATMVFSNADAPTAGNWDRPVQSTLEIRLGDYFSKYLQSLDLPEVVLFSRVVVRDPTSSDKEKGKIVYERVLLNTEANSDYTAANQGAGSAMRDVILLPSILYDRQDITVSLRLIELDQADNERFKSLLSAVAATTASFQPEATMAISAAQAALGFLLANNPDDLEFTYDFGLSPDSGTSVARIRQQMMDSQLPTGVAASESHDLVLQPRIGTLTVLKTELPDRLVFPTDKVALVTDGVRWGAMSAVRLGTLNFFNWFNEDKGYDRYSRAFGQPLQPSYQAMDEPLMDDNGYVYHVDYYPVTSVVGGAKCGASPSGKSGFWNAVADMGTGEPKRLRMINGNLAYEDCHGQTGLTPFREKSYLTFSIDSPAKGVAVSDLAKLTDSVKDLGIRTTQLSPKEFADALKVLTDSLNQVAVAQNAKSDGNRQVAGATDLTDAATVAKNTLKSACDSLKEKGTDKETMTRYLNEIRQQLEKDLARKEKEVCKITLMRPADGVFTESGTIEALIEQRPGQEYTGVLLGPSTDTWDAAPITSNSTAKQFTKVSFKAAEGATFGAGDYSLRLLPKNGKEEEKATVGTDCAALPAFSAVCHEQQTIPLHVNPAPPPTTTTTLPPTTTTTLPL